MSEFFRDHFSAGLPVVALAGLAVGTLVDTDRGPRTIEAFNPGDLVHTLDEGLRPVKEILRHSGRGTAGTAPVRIAAGMFGCDVPLIVAPQHCV